MSPLNQTNLFGPGDIFYETGRGLQAIGNFSLTGKFSKNSEGDQKYC